MSTAGRLAAATASAAIALVALAGAAVAAGPEFVDQRAIVLDVDAREARGPWRVEVVNATDKPTTITLHTAGLDPLDIAPRTSASLDPGRTTSFTIRLRAGARPTNGQLLAVTATGATARRDVRIVHGARTGPVPDVRLTGRRLAPFIGPVSMETVESERLAPSDGGVATGIVQAADGGLGRVVDIGGRVSVHGIRQAGEYTGTLPLGDGREANVTVKVQDSFVWAALVLLAGLLLAGRLDDYAKRGRPRRQLHRRLEQQRKELLAVQRRVAAKAPAVPLVTREEGSTAAFVFDNEVEAALRTMATADTDDARAMWTETGAEYTKLVAFKDRCTKLLGDHETLATKLDAVGRRLGHDDPPATHIPILDDVRDCLAVGGLVTESDLADHEARLAAQGEALRTFTETLEIVDDMRRDPTVDDAGVQAARELRQILLQSPGPLAVIAERVATLAATVTRRPAPLTVSAPQPTEALTAPAAVHVADAHGPLAVKAPGSRRMLPVFVGLAALVVVVLATTPTLFLSGGVDEPPSDGGAGEQTTTALPGPTSVPPPASTTTTVTVPPAPTAVVSPTLSAGDLDPVPSVSARWGLELVLPLVLALLAALAYRVRRPVVAVGSRLLGSRQQGDDADAQPPGERAFAFMSGLIVVLTGMSVLYFTDDTFGSLGDYVKVFLWGSAVGEGVQLARRIVPRFGPAAG